MGLKGQRLLLQIRMISILHADTFELLVQAHKLEKSSLDSIELQAVRKSALEAKTIFGRTKLRSLTTLLSEIN